MLYHTAIIPKRQTSPSSRLSDVLSGDGLDKPLRRGVYVHVIQHSVANRPRIQGVIGCCSKLAQAAGDCAARVIHTIRTARAQRSRQNVKALPDGYNGLLSGTATVRSRLTILRIKIRCFRFGVQKSALG
jgi:hypothetical protein